MSDSLSHSVAQAESWSATNLHTPYQNELDSNTSRSDDKKSVSAAVNTPTLSPNSSAQKSCDLSVNDLEQDDNGVLNKAETANAPLSNLFIPEDYDLDVNNWRSDDNSVPDDSGGASEQRYYDIQPTWTTNIELTKISAEACWHSQQTMLPMKLDIHWSKERALFKLNTGIRLIQASGKPITHRKAYIFIYPERINQLALKANPTSKHFCSPISLTFSLNKPSDLFLPKTRCAFTKQAEDVITSLRSLVQQSSFTINADLPRRKLSLALLGKFCEEINNHTLSSIISLSNWKNLYKASGEEADMIEGDSLLKSIIHGEDAANLRPPAYQEDPSVPRICSAKRKARDSDTPLSWSTKRRNSEDSSKIGRSLQDAVAEQPLFGNASDAKFISDERKLEEVLSVFRCTLDEKLSTHKQEVKEMLNIHKQEVEERLSTHKQEVEEMLSTHKQEVQNQVCDVKDAVTDIVVETIDEKMSEEMEAVRESILDKVSSAYITIPGFS